ncbi:MAG: STAS domain-containing protein [Acidobacteriaceae bacterium]
MINQKLGRLAILRCQGRIVRGQETAILCAAAQQNGRDVILDLSQVNAIDAGGLGALVSLRAAGICHQTDGSDRASASDIKAHQTRLDLRDL